MNCISSFIMASIGLFIVIVQALAAAQCYLNICLEQREKRVVRTTVSDGGDPGEPLFLSPLIAAGRLDEARRRARVALTPDLGIVSYAGYLTVNETYNSNQFIWYFPSIVEDSSKAPVLVWLQGGPGMSSLYGLFIENGPFVVQNGTFKRREHTWALNHHLIYIDNPVGTGFSFTENERGYCTNETQVGEQLYSSVTQFFKLFPELQKNKFFISGESYAGKYIPALAYAIHKKNPTAETKINLQGMAIGGGWCDPIHHFVYSPYLYQHGFIDWNKEKNIEQFETETVKCIENQDWNRARNIWTEFLSGLDINLYNYNTSIEIMNLAYLQLMPYALMVEKSTTRKAIHVGNKTYDDFSTKVCGSLGEDTMKSVAPWISELLKHYNVTFYNGQLDVIVAYPLTVNFLRALPFSAAGEYARAPRKKWLVQCEVAGYAKTAGRLTELLVRGAGHMVPADQPLWAHDLITRVTHGIPFH